MTPRLEAALAELFDALRDELAPAAAAAGSEPERALSIDDAAAALTLSRRRLYGEIAAGRIRTIHAGRRHLVPASAISEYLAGQS